MKQVEFYHHLRGEWCTAEVLGFRDVIAGVSQGYGLGHMTRAMIDYPRVFVRRCDENAADFVISDRTLHNLEVGGFLRSDGTIIRRPELERYQES